MNQTLLGTEGIEQGFCTLGGQNAYLKPIFVSVWKLTFKIINSL